MTDPVLQSMISLSVRAFHVFGRILPKASPIEEQEGSPTEGGGSVNKLMIGSAVGFMAGVGLMMMPVGRTIRKDVQKGMNKAKQMMKDMEQGQGQ